MRIRSSFKVTVAVLAVFGGCYGAWRAYNNYSLSRYHLSEIVPGRINLVAIKPGAGYRIIVANQVAQLAEVSQSTFDAPGDREEQGEVNNGRKLPIKELLASLQGDEVALGRLVMSLNDMSEANLPPERNIWKAEDIRRALDGDPTLQKRLAEDLHVGLDGNPPDYLNLKKLLNGIVIENPVRVSASVGGVRKTLTGAVLEPFRSQFSRSFENRIKDKFNLPVEQLEGIYIDETTPLRKDPAKREDVRKSLEARIAPAHVDQLAEKPARVLSNAVVVLNESFIKGASTESYNGPNSRKLYDISVHLTDEGRMRLWKYSHEHQGFQLLLIVDDVAVAAPRIRTELSERTVKITQLSAGQLVEDAVNGMNQASGGTKR